MPFNTFNAELKQAFRQSLVENRSCRHMILINQWEGNVKAGARCILKRQVILPTD